MMKFLKSLTRAKPHSKPLMSNADFNAIVLPAFDEVLTPLGFTSRPKDRLWVRSTDAPIRQTFWIDLWKGASASPSWGLSLDFVPHRVGDRFAWHRTEKSVFAYADLLVRDQSDPYRLSRLATEADLRAQLAKVLPLSIQEAQEFWDAGRAIDNLPALFEQVEAEANTKRKAFPWSMVPQCRLAKAFAFRAAGRIEESEALLEAWIHTESQPQLSESLQAESIADLRQRFTAIP